MEKWEQFIVKFELGDQIFCEPDPIIDNIFVNLPQHLPESVSKAGNYILLLSITEVDRTFCWSSII
jgi:hypothetical protein